MTKLNALSECRTAVNYQIKFLETEIGIEEAFPVTIGLLRLSQDLTQRINVLQVPICATPGDGETRPKAFQKESSCIPTSTVRPARIVAGLCLAATLGFIAGHWRDYWLTIQIVWIQLFYNDIL